MYKTVISKRDTVDTQKTKLTRKQVNSKPRKFGLNLSETDVKGTLCEPCVLLGVF